MSFADKSFKEQTVNIAELRVLIAATLAKSEDPDPHVVARRLLRNLTDDDLRDIALAWLPDVVRAEIRHSRVPLPESGSRIGSSRLATYAAALQRALPDGYVVGGKWKRLEDCTAEDCDAIADSYAKRARENAAIEQQFRELAHNLRRHHAATVADLGRMDDLKDAA